MLIYSDDFDNEMRKVLDKILPFKKGSTYDIKGSYKRKIKYITDIDVVLKLPKYFSTLSDTDFGKIVSKILRKYMFSLPNDENYIFVHMITGDDDRFTIKTKDDLTKLFDQQMIDVTDMDNFLKMSVAEINEHLSSYKKLRWTKKEVIKGIKVRFGKEFLLSEVLSNKRLFTLVSASFYNDYIYSFDITCLDRQIKLSDIYQRYYEPAIQRANNEGYPYFILRLIGRFLDHTKTDQNLSNEIFEIVENKLGAYKQLMLRAQLVQKLIIEHLLIKGQLRRIYKTFYDDFYELKENDLLKILTMKNPLSEMEMIERESLKIMNRQSLPYLKEVVAGLDPKIRNELILIDLDDLSVS